MIRQASTIVRCTAVWKEGKKKGVCKKINTDNKSMQNAPKNEVQLTKNILMSDATIMQHEELLMSSEDQMIDSIGKIMVP